MDKSLLFAPRAGTDSGYPEDDVDVAGMGTVRVRGLSRFEVLHVQNTDDSAKRERQILALALLDPTMTEAEVGRWQKASDASEMEPVSEKVAELSGMQGGSGKAIVKEFVANPDAEFPVLPSGETGPDGGPATGGNA